MASVCDVCGKGRQMGFKISHSNIKTKKAWRPNIQKIRADVNGATKRLNVCTRCLKAGKVKRAI